MILRAENVTATQPDGASLQYALLPGSNIALIRGEHIELAILDTARTHVSGKGIAWAINGRAIDQVGRDAGKLSVAGNDASGIVATYKAPDQLPSKNPVEISATISVEGTQLTLTSRVTVISSPNWFAIDGDTGIGSRTAIIQLNSGGLSSAGMYNGPISIMKNKFLVSIFGTEQGDPKSLLTIHLGIEPNGQPGTYLWHGRNPSIGATVDLFAAKKTYFSLDMDSAGWPISLEGSTTIMKPDATDSPGLVKGFYSGKLRWAQPMRSTTIPKNHYLTILGHFAVPGT